MSPNEATGVKENLCRRREKCYSEGVTGLEVQHFFTTRRSGGPVVILPGLCSKSLSVCLLVWWFYFIILYPPQVSNIWMNLQLVPLTACDFKQLLKRSSPAAQPHVSFTLTSCLWLTIFTSLRTWGTFELGLCGQMSSLWGVSLEPLVLFFPPVICSCRVPVRATTTAGSFQSTFRNSGDSVVRAAGLAGAKWLLNMI